MKDYGFDVCGYFEIRDDLKPMLAFDGSVCGFKLPDGREVRLVVALEVAEADESSFEYVTSEPRMASLGFGCLEYGQTSFEEFNNEDNL